MNFKNRVQLIPLFISLCTFFMGFGYAAFNSITGEITGTVSAEVPEGVFISNIEYNISTNVEIANSSYILNSTTLANNIDITENTTSFSIKYLVTVYNNSDSKVGYYGFICDQEFGDNAKIDVTVEDIERGDSLVVGDDIQFYVTISSKVDADLTEGVINSYINFVFSKQYEITYVDFNETTTYPTKVMEMEELNISFENNISDFEVRMGGILLTEGVDYQYSNYVFTISNVTSNLVIKNTSKYTITFVTDGGSAVSAMEVSTGEEYTLPIPTKANSVHMGWFVGSETGVRFPNSGTYNYSKDITLYSRWGIVYDRLANSEGTIYTFKTNDKYHNIQITADTEQGSLKMQVTGTDPYVAMYFVEGKTINANEYKYIVVGYQIPSAVNVPDAEMKMAAVPIAQDGSEEIYPAGYVRVSTVKNDEYLEAAVFDFSSQTNYRENCTAFRIDCYDGDTATVGAYNSIYSVEFYKTAEDAASAAEYIKTIKHSPRYTVNFNSMGGSTVASKNLRYGEAYGELPVPTRSTSEYPYVFLGWYTAENGGSKVFDSTIFNYNNDITLYAHWAINYSITRDIANGVVTFKQTGQNSTTITYDSTEGAYKLQVSGNAIDPFMTVEITGKDVPIDEGEYKYVVVAYRIPESLNLISTSIVMYPLLGIESTPIQYQGANPNLYCVVGYEKSDTHQSAAIFDFSQASAFSGVSWGVRIDYFSQATQGDYMYLYDVWYCQSAQDAENVAGYIRSISVN